MKSEDTSSNPVLDTKSKTLACYLVSQSPFPHLGKRNYIFLTENIDYNLYRKYVEYINMSKIWIISFL